MLSLDEAQARLLGSIEPLSAEVVPLADALERHAAIDHVARRTQPPFAASAMDGYAIRYDDLPGPWRLIGESSAGCRFAGSVGVAKTVRIFTGAPLPVGADTVLVQEEAARNGKRVALGGDGPPRCGAHVRPAGLDFEEGAHLVAAGERLTPARIGLLASGGYDEVAVSRQPRVALLSTGNELVAAGSPMSSDQIVDANGPMLSALLRQAGAIVKDLGIVPDDPLVMTAAIERARGCDLLLTIGGASVGEKDLVVPVLTAAGAMIDFWKVAIKPGKPMLTGTIGYTRVIGLPGNPVSAFVCAQLFVLPVLRQMAGVPTPLPPMVEARTTTPLQANGARRDHLRARLAWYEGAWSVTPAQVQDSSMLRMLAGCNALLVQPEYADAIPAGTVVPVIPLDSLVLGT